MTLKRRNSYDILDSELSEECIDFTMMSVCFFFKLFVSEETFYSKKNA